MEVIRQGGHPRRNGASLPVGSARQARNCGNKTEEEEGQSFAILSLSSTNFALISSKSFPDCEQSSLIFALLAIRLPLRLLQSDLFCSQDFHCCFQLIYTAPLQSRPDKW